MFDCKVVTTVLVSIYTCVVLHLLAHFSTTLAHCIYVHVLCYFTVIMFILYSVIISVWLAVMLRVTSSELYLKRMMIHEC